MTQFSGTENREEKFSALLFCWGFFHFQDEAASLVFRNVSVEDSAKDAADGASSVQASFQSLKIHSLVVLLLLSFVCRMLWHVKESPLPLVTLIRLCLQKVTCSITALNT